MFVPHFFYHTGVAMIRTILTAMLAAGTLSAGSALNRIYDLLEHSQYKKALTIADSLVQAEGQNRRNMQAKYYIYDALGEYRKALEAALAAENVNPKKSPWDCIAIAETEIKLSDPDQAMHWLQTAADRGFKSYKTLSDSLYDPLRTAPGFDALIERIKTGIGIGKPAGSLELTLLDGMPFTLASQAGKVVLIDFWATWCSPCRAEMPNLKKIYAENRDKGLEIIGISLDNSEDKLKDYIENESLTWKFAYSGKAWEDPDAQRYGVNSIPSIWIVDKKGILRDFDVRGEALQNLVAELIQE